MGFGGSRSQFSRDMADEQLVESNDGTCSGKRDYGYIGEAKSAANGIFRSSGERLSAYRCNHCGGFHIGHSKNNQVWKRAADGSVHKKQNLGGDRQARSIGKKRNLSRAKQKRVRRRR